MNKPITAEFLKEKGVCSGAIRRFKEMFPKGAELNPKNFRKYFKNNFDNLHVEILADILCSRKGEDWFEYYYRYYKKHGKYKFYASATLEDTIPRFFKAIPKKWRV